MEFNPRDRKKLTKEEALSLLNSGDMSVIKAYHKSIGLDCKAIKKKD
jgi:hypothetical protein